MILLDESLARLPATSDSCVVVMPLGTFGGGWCPPRGWRASRPYFAGRKACVSAPLKFGTLSRRAVLDAPLHRESQMAIQIPKEIIVALIALSGVLLSVILSTLTSRNLIRNELRKLQLEAEQLYTSEILKKRADTYQKLYFLLSNFGKEIQYINTSFNSMKVFLSKLDKIDSEIAVFYSGRTQTICYRFRKMIKQLIEEGNEALEEKLKSPEFRYQLYQKSGAVELALKSDLGIYGVRFSDLETRVNVIHSLSEQAQVNDAPFDTSDMFDLPVRKELSK
ncbi:MAG TPA: hypothetical protein VJU82_00605 [Acidobacteriaceae bacterium]|nr:hypothetical protein [Acidobacteriaceae bacterium]